MPQDGPKRAPELILRDLSVARPFSGGPGGHLELEVAQDGPKRAPGIILQDFIVVRRPSLGPSWARLGLPWGLLGPSWGVQEGILRQILGLEGLMA